MALSLAALLPPERSAANAPLQTFPAPPASVAVVGRLPSSAPVHLALDSIASAGDDSNDVALILARSGSEWASALLSDGKGGDGDAWFAQEAGRAGVMRQAHRVVIKYLPTLAHLSLFLSLLHYGPDPPPGSDPHPARLEKRPTVVILHEPTSFLVNWQGPSDPDDEASREQRRQECSWRTKPGTAIASLSLPLSLAISSVTNLNASLSALGLPPTQLVVLDSLATSLSLPILPPRDDGKKGPDITAQTMIDRLFDWVAVVRKDADDDNTSEAVQLDHHIILPPASENDNMMYNISFREDLDTSIDRWRPNDEGRSVWRWLGAP